MDRKGEGGSFLYYLYTPDLHMYYSHQGDKTPTDENVILYQYPYSDSFTTANQLEKDE